MGNAKSSPYWHLRLILKLVVSEYIEQSKWTEKLYPTDKSIQIKIIGSIKKLMQKCKYLSSDSNRVRMR